MLKDVIRDVRLIHALVLVTLQGHQNLIGKRVLSRFDPPEDCVHLDLGCTLWISSQKKKKKK